MTHRFGRLGAVAQEFKEKEQAPPEERLIWTEMYKGHPEARAVHTATFDDQGGRTALMLLAQHANEGHRAAHIESGVEASRQEAMDRLEQVVVSLRHDDAAPDVSG